MMHASGADDHTPFLHTLPTAVRTAFQQLGNRRCYAPRDILISEGDPAHDLVLLREGLVKVTTRLHGEGEGLVDIRRAGDVVGEMAAMDSKPRSATVIAYNDVVATVIPPHDLRPFLAATPEASQALKALLCGRLRRAERKLLIILGFPVKVRLARVLVELTDLYGCRTRSQYRIDVNLTQAEYAALTGCKVRAIQEAFTELRREDLIDPGYRRTNILNLEKLREVALLSAPAA
ncbi:Crp/Fnr family transcriptional regulator [Streptomyces monomycini]|uniref:Crp/Fnr family transcriptional regulator n=1 Tax=Streptomyces monomycini TaxID=371720 RepID=UPI00067E07D8|nr:Crp/Fnr family transcriptional regulator [Streptomyces monomycini]